MSYLLPHLHSGWAVDQAILAEEERLVVIRFGHDWDETCMQIHSTMPWHKPYERRRLDVEEIGSGSERLERSG
ncbi:Thioredoxin-like superfamily [Sesbania bispinosa]|nr:Thioredoxin-like superfamily [Sesbania bispinosa]